MDSKIVLMTLSYSIIIIIESCIIIVRAQKTKTLFSVNII